MSHASRRIAARFLMASVATVGLAGCTGDNPGGADGERTGVIKPTVDGKTQTTAAAPSDRVLATLETVTVRESELVPLLYEAYGLESLLKILQRNMARAEAARVGVTVTQADIDNERKLTIRQAVAGQVAEDEDVEPLLPQLLARLRTTRAEFDVAMDMNAHLRASVRGQAGADISAEAIRNEFNLLYGERVRVRDIPVNNMQEVGEVQRALAEPGARFEEVARRYGKIPALAQLGGELPEFARTTPGYSQVFIDAAFAMQPGQVSTDAIQDRNYYHVIKVEARVAPKVVKFEDVESTVREQLILRRTNILMGQTRQRFGQQALRELKLDEPTMRKQFEERLAAANPKPADRSEVQRSLEQQQQQESTTKPATGAVAPTIAAPTTAASTEPAAPATVPAK